MDNATPAMRDFAITSHGPAGPMSWAQPAPELSSAPQRPGHLRRAIITACCVVAVTVSLASAIDHRQAASFSRPAAAAPGEAPHRASFAELSFVPAAAPSQRPPLGAENPGAAGQTLAIRHIAEQKPAPDIVVASHSDRPTLTRSIGGAEAEMTSAPIRRAPTPPVGAPIRVVLMVSSGEQDSERVADVRRALGAAGLSVESVNVADRPITKPGVAYYFQPDRNAATSLLETIAPVIGVSDVQAADLRAARQKGFLPPPGSIEISIP
ncbi:hypothetical protein Msil_0996 [Methylocella silvestris BL2]|uniref:Uncharacterized protein n=1 Tax=Methylocella silvestris (strain DSM 15510 / CIP 108128 / LMG 27833 / NCIMB 13906 / BL2) TaxID=395965 RepID=B8EK18_METSB|nr:hypothetical protein [Methylocella silvestris]ACK49965.1 hypothetical protein Msil_0996 [Methylocella silvestris BL2]